MGWTTPSPLARTGIGWVDAVEGADFGPEQAGLSAYRIGTRDGKGRGQMPVGTRTQPSSLGVILAISGHSDADEIPAPRLDRETGRSPVSRLDPAVATGPATCGPCRVCRRCRCQKGLKRDQLFSADGDHPPGQTAARLHWRLASSTTCLFPVRVLGRPGDCGRRPHLHLHLRLLRSDLVGGRHGTDPGRSSGAGNLVRAGEVEKTAASW